MQWLLQDGFGFIFPPFLSAATVLLQGHVSDEAVRFVLIV